jgi:hypothetical protein
MSRYPTLKDFEKDLGVKEGFFAGFENEDDWSFIIKLHAVFEAACTSMLDFHFKEPELYNVFSRLELSNKTIGKALILNKLGLMLDEDKKYIYALSELRNNLVHEVKNINFDLKAYISELDNNQIRQFVVAFRPFEAFYRRMRDKNIQRSKENPKIKRLPIDPIMERQSNIEELIKDVKDDPKDFIWLGAYSALTNIFDSEGLSSFKQMEKYKKLYEENDEESD